MVVMVRVRVREEEGEDDGVAVMQSGMTSLWLVKIGAASRSTNGELEDVPWTPRDGL